MSAFTHTSRYRASIEARLRAWPLWLELLLALLAGAVHAQTFDGSDLWWLQIACVVLLAWRVMQASTSRAAFIGLAFGTAWLVAGTWWMYISMHDYGGLPAWMAGLSVLLLSAFLSLYLAAAMALFAHFRCGSVTLDALRFGACWLLAEIARAVLFTGFPWAASGYAHGDGPLVVLAPWVGVYGIGFASAVLAALAAAFILQARRAAVPAVAGAVIAGVLSALDPWPFTEPSGTLSLTLLQTNVSQDEKFVAERMPENLGWLRDQLLAATGELVVAPETAIPLLPSDLDPSYWQPLTAHFQKGGQSALIGVPLGSLAAGYTNSVIGLSSDSRDAPPDGFYRYDKHHLVPFGEFIPSGFRWFTEMMNIPLGDFNRGPLVAPSFEVRGGAGNVERVAPNICYEDLFGEELAARFRDARSAPTIFANVSNIGWFGDTVAVPQHRQISRMRTLEFQRPMVRATNTGATVVIDHTGRVKANIAPFKRGVLNTSVEGRTGLTPFAQWASAAGLWPLAVLAALILLVGGLVRRRRIQRKHPEPPQGHRL